MMVRQLVGYITTAPLATAPIKTWRMNTMTKIELHDIRLTDQQLAHLKTFLKYAYEVYCTRKELIDENTEMSLLELIASIESQTK
jgi:hypothetical protein